MPDALVYIGAKPTKAWARVHWAGVASSRKSLAELLEGFDGRRRAFFVVSEAKGWNWLMDTLVSRRSRHHWRSRVLALAHVEHTWSVESLLDARFDACVRRPPVMLPPEELVEVIEQSHRGYFCIGGEVDHHRQVVVLVRGNLDVLAVPLTAFNPSGDGVRPAFDDFEVIDYGQTLRFGPYEASFDAVLYDMDEGYRRQLRQQRRASERTFGAALRRLRAQKGLTRADFPGLSPKSLARIERGEVSKPQTRTLQRIADRLGVSVHEIDQY